MAKKKTNPIMVILIIIGIFFVMNQQGFIGSVVSSDPLLVTDIQTVTFSNNFVDSSNPNADMHGVLSNMPLFVTRQIEYDLTPLSVVKVNPGTANSALGMSVVYSESSSPGGYIDVAHDGTVTRVYTPSLPFTSEEQIIFLFFADDGSSYWDIDLTDLAVPAPCFENWQCTEWSACSNGQQTRTCNDVNACGTENNKPSETQECVANPDCTNPDAMNGQYFCENLEIGQISVCQNGQWAFYGVCEFNAPNYCAITEVSDTSDVCSEQSNQQCNTFADFDCDGVVTRDELGVAIGNWLEGSIERNQLGVAIEAWLN